MSQGISARPPSTVTTLVWVPSGTEAIDPPEMRACKNKSVVSGSLDMESVINGPQNKIGKAAVNQETA